MAEEGRGLILEESKEAKSCCSCCCVLRWSLCGAVLLAGAAAALILCVLDLRGERQMRVTGGAKLRAIKEAMAEHISI